MSGFPVIGNLPIMPEQCQSCPWQTNGRAIKLARGRREEIEAYLRRGQTHICHNTGHRGGIGKPVPVHTCAGSVAYMASVGIHTEDDRVAVILKDLGATWEGQ